MKTLTNILTLAFLVAVITSCSSVLDNKIDTVTIETDIKEIKANNPDLDSTKTEILDNLLALSKGRDTYVNERIKSKETTESLEKYVVDDDKFKEVTDNLFNHFKANEITYQDFLNEIDSLNALKEKYDNKLKSVYVEIDKICTEKQKEMDARDAKAEKIKEQLNEMVDLEIVSITKTERDYRDVIQVKIKMTNKTNKKVEALGFNMVLTDKLDNDIATLRCKSNDGFTTSDVGYWVYGRYKQSETFSALQNIKVSHVTAKKEITKINLGGEIISAYDDDLENLFLINYEYTTSDKLIGYCPYLDKEDDLMKQIRDESDKKSKEIKDRLELLNKYQELITKLFDFS